MNAAPDATFRELVAPHENALRLHCYRMLGSSHDSDDVMQETLLRAWRARDSLADAAAVRPWLYRIATNACLDELKHRKQRPLPSDVVAEATDPSAAPAPANPEITWLEPCPDAWLQGAAHDPAAAYDLKESVALAFVAALQCLNAQQRAVLLLRDVLGMPADETATALSMTVSAANSTLHRARTALREKVGGREEHVTPVVSDNDEVLLGRYIRAWETLDLNDLVTLLHEDIIVSMPPSPTWLRGRSAARVFIGTRPFAALARSPLRIVRVNANGQPALAFYVGGELHALQVIRVRDGRVLEMHHFCSDESFAAFQLPRVLGGPMHDPLRARARAAADVARGTVLATVEVAASPERVFAALASDEITRWWVRPGVFDTTEWSGELRVGGRWSAAGNGRAGRYLIEGEFTHVEPPRALAHTWKRIEAPGPPTTVRYEIDPIEGGSRVTLHHEGFTSREVCAATAIGWETSFEKLAQLLGSRARDS